MNIEALKEAVKEGLRVLLLAVVPILIAGVQGGGVDFKLVGVVGLLAVLKFVDSWLHESGQAVNGLTRF